MNSYRRTPIRARTTHNKGSACAFCASALYTASRQRASSKSRRGELHVSNNLKALYYEYALYEHVPVRSYLLRPHTRALFIMMSALRSAAKLSSLRELMPHGRASSTMPMAQLETLTRSFT
jgi:hypothetical protein